MNTNKNLDNNKAKRRSTFAVLFYINRTKVRKDGMCQLLCKVSIDAEWEQIGTKVSVNPDIWNRLQERTNEIIEQQDFDSADLGILSKKIENEIKGDIRNINRNHIVPSIALKIIADEYGKKQKHAYDCFLFCRVERPHP